MRDLIGHLPIPHSIHTKRKTGGIILDPDKKKATIMENGGLYS